jgi:hypothetical protein
VSVLLIEPDGFRTVLKGGIKISAGEVIDAAVMDVRSDDRRSRTRARVHARLLARLLHAGTRACSLARSLFRTSHARLRPAC